MYPSRDWGSRSVVMVLFPGRWVVGAAAAADPIRVEVGMEVSKVVVAVEALMN